MHPFYAPEIADGNFTLDAIQSKHCVQVLRHQQGDSIYLVDGKGTLYEALISDANSKRCKYQVKSKTEAYEAMPFELHIAIAPTKNSSRLEWFLEKATEIGISTITPIFTQHSERRKLRTERLQKILITAMKQSGKAYLPQLNEPIKLSQFLKKEALFSQYQSKTIAYVPENGEHLKSVYQKQQNALILVGPEGGFHASEVAQCEQKGFKAVSLGQSRLRTETAGIVACTLVHLLNEG